MKRTITLEAFVTEYLGVELNPWQAGMLRKLKQRSVGMKACAVCGKLYRLAASASITCSPECRRARRNLLSKLDRPAKTVRCCSAKGCGRRVTREKPICRVHMPRFILDEVV